MRAEDFIRRGGRALRAALMLLALAAPASARTLPQGARLIRGLDGTVSGGAGSFEGARSRSFDFANVPLPAGAVQIDSTYYDLQDFGSLGTRIVSTPDGKIHVTYEDDFCELDVDGCPPDPSDPRVFSPRGMAYAYRDAMGVWTRLGKVQDLGIPDCTECGGPVEDFGGFGTIAVLPSGRVAISQHKNQDSCDMRGDLYIQNAVGGSTYKGYLTPISDNLFPQVGALPNGSFTLLGEVPLAASYLETQSFQISRLAAEGGSVSYCPNTGWPFGNWTNVVSPSLFRDGFPGFPSLAVASNGRAGIAVTDFGSTPPTRPGNVFLIESSNGTFASGTLTIRTLTNYTDASITASDSTSTQFRPYIHCHLAYNDTTPNVVWSELQVRRDGTNIKYADHKSRIRHWDPIRGITTVKQVGPGEADSYDNIDNGYSGPLSGFNTISVDWPQVGFSSDGTQTYVAWLRFVDAEVDPTADAGLGGICTGIGFGDIAASYRTGNDPWAAAQNLTNTPRTDERFFSIPARNAGGMLRVLFQASSTDQAGCALIGDRGNTPGNVLRRIAYLERPLGGPTAVDPVASASFALRVFPNPAQGRVRFALPGTGGVPRSIEVYGVDGRHVATVRSEAGAAEWNGRDRTGKRAPGGLYLARVAGAAQSTFIKFLLLH